ncbi:MAG: anti-sigma factor antagonist [Prolixibacteraceae bacterium]|jgi:anti-anti-sigma factor|nr:anti-sigma factor antagonist [Prolixibacteraceae bacterium]
MLTFSIQKHETATHIALVGRLDTITNKAFDSKLQTLLNNQFLIIDLDQCNYVSSSGIRSLLKHTKYLKKIGGELIISNTHPEVYRVFEMAGLHKVFIFSNSVKKALEITQNKINEEACCSELEINEYKLLAKPLDNESNPKVLWTGKNIAGYDELAFSIGLGFPDFSEFYNESVLFVTTPNCAAFIPPENAAQADFRVAENPSEGVLILNEAISFGENANMLLQFKKSSILSAQQFLNAWNVKEQSDNHSYPIFSAAIITGNIQNTPSLVFIGAIPSSIQHLAGLKPKNTYQTSDNQKFCGIQFLLDKIKENTHLASSSEFCNQYLTLENISDVELFDFSQKIESPKIWLFVNDKNIKAEEKILKIETANNTDLQAIHKYLCRKLYKDSARITLKKLHGGFSAQTFQVTSYDFDGRKLRPTVLKIADTPMIEREATRCTEYAMPYILNNSAIILGTTFFEHTGALRYNFVGIGGETKKLKWLADYYRKWSIEQLVPLFDKIFLDILKPWYGQAIPATLYPFLEHNPTLTFFTELISIAEEYFSISANDKYIKLDDFDETIINPYWFLKNRYRQNIDKPLNFYSAICHGDLNMQNILLDDNLNVYLIDFSETKPRSVVSDFARLEAIFMIEHTKFENIEDREKTFNIYKKIYKTSPFSYKFDVDGLSGEFLRNITMSRKMRQYAVESTPESKVNIAYYLALLEWVLPVVCYRSATNEQKKMSMLIAGWLCERIQNEWTLSTF